MSFCCNSNDSFEKDHRNPATPNKNIVRALKLYIWLWQQHYLKTTLFIQPFRSFKQKHSRQTYCYYLMAPDTEKVGENRLTEMQWKSVFLVQQQKCKMGRRQRYRLGNYSQWKLFISVSVRGSHHQVYRNNLPVKILIIQFCYIFSDSKHCEIKRHYEIQLQNFKASLEKQLKTLKIARLQLTIIVQMA